MVAESFTGQLYSYASPRSTRRSQLMSRKSGVVSDPGLEHARALSARVLNFIISDSARLTRFLQLTGCSLESLHEAAQSPLFMLSVLGSVAKDQPLLSALAEQERITPEMIEMTRARLAFQVSLEAVQHGQSAREAATIRKKVQDQLRRLLQRIRERSGGGRSTSA